jgi:HD-like signal output (HDOD) protein
MGKDASELLNRVDDLPPLPAVAAKVMSMAEDDKTSAMDLAGVLATDQALTAKLIRISNSAYYGFARRISTVREAVVMLGFQTGAPGLGGCEHDERIQAERGR